MKEGMKDAEHIGPSRYGQMVSYLVRQGYKKADLDAVLGQRHGDRTNKEVRDAVGVLITTTPKRATKIFGITIG